MRIDNAVQNRLYSNWWRTDEENKEEETRKAYLLTCSVNSQLVYEIRGPLEA